MASASASSASGLQQIDLTKLNYNQLAKLQDQLDQELTIFQESLQTLKIAQRKFMDSEECLQKMTPATEGKAVLVPLTGSMYVPGTITDTQKVIIDIGTGYYAQKDIESGKDYFKRKVQFVTEQMEKIQALGIEKSKAREAIAMIIQMKAQAAAKASTS